MKTINLQRELKFIHYKQVKTLEKDSLMFELLNIAQTMLSNYAVSETKKVKLFYQIVYFKTKSFYLQQRIKKL